MKEIYAPNTGLKAKLERRAARILSCRNVALELERPIISFSFDDCPKSALDNGASLLEAEGWRATFYMAMGLCGQENHLGLHMSEDDVKAANKAGHEIADHTFTHIDAQQTSLPNFIADIDKNQARLNGLNIPPSRSFAYPYGCVSPSVKKRIANKFDLARGVHDPNQSTIDTALLPSMRMYNRQTIDSIIAAIETLNKAPQWLTLFTHDVRENPSVFGCRPADMKRIIKAIKDSGVQVMPMIEALDFIND